MYLGKKLEERQRSEPFFNFLSTVHDATSSKTKALGLMNIILKSDIQTWAQHLQEIFKEPPLGEMIAFWKFISELLYFMPTSALQVTLIEAIKLENQLGDEQGTRVLRSPRLALLRVIRIGGANMKEHISILKEVNKPERVIDIFTREEQDKLGVHRMHLEGKWSSFEEELIYQHWASYHPRDLAVSTARKVKYSMKPVLLNVSGKGSQRITSSKM
ncbi:uncharacterized protein MELLADRAFT_111752 [Melampsora larici-populina 98AG31]|uniref:Uncharacterized protein n=1 Tax=Melampsora larici-populina (strain 98AG31 / pathotype 3-4-7) TaxID=747676 RepID=F4S441_MELLP|nr:uncharacterized protein MELLADRAFT_111752 [Melampsora larici-populina 98AG31]EGG00519.1 hypothetical protein MELLADRAFT_111752 [Melampsora larici-populina 98AG31]